MASLVALLGRILLALIFIMSGISKVGGHSSTVAYIHAHGLPLASVCLYAAILIELLGGVLLATGFRARYGALVLALYLIPTTYFFHFKPAMDGQFNVVDKGQLIHVLKNLAIMGSLLMIWANGVGKLTLGKDE
jgi:putative oxidoreductase